MKYIQRVEIPLALTLTSFLILTFATVTLAIQRDQRFVKNPIIAKIDSIPLKLREIEDKKIHDLMTELHHLLSLRLREHAIQQLAKRHPKYRAKPSIDITDREAKEFYEANNMRSRGTYKRMYPLIKNYLAEQATYHFYKKQYEEAVRQGLIVSFLEKPDDFLVRVPLETAFLTGNKRAKVVVLEFSDYQCPFCSRVQATITKLKKRYKNRVLFGYRHAPLSFHTEADEAALAAECARDQGKFNSIHQILFRNPRRQRVPDLISYGRKVKIKDQKKYRACLTSEKYRSRISNDMRTAAKAGINGAPGFVIGTFDRKDRVVIGEVLSGARPEIAFTEMIDKYLKR